MKSVYFIIALIVFYGAYGHSQEQGALDKSEFSSDDPAQKDFGQKEAAQSAMGQENNGKDEFGANDVVSGNPPAPAVDPQDNFPQPDTVQENAVRKSSNELSRAHGVSSKLKAKIEIMDKSIEAETSKADKEKKETVKEIKQIVQLQSQLSIRQKRVNKLRAQIKASVEKNERLRANTARLFAQIKNLAIEERQLLQQKVQFDKKDVPKKDAPKKDLTKKDVAKKDINRQLASKLVKPDPRQGPRHN